MYINRIAEQTIHRLLSVFPVLGITGPRQSGKSTMLRHTLKHYRYITFDDPKNIDYFENDPDGFMTEYNHYVIFDEVQHVPQLFHYVKMTVDNNRDSYGQFILTGSSQFNYIKSISESLAGRIGLLSLLPLQHTEIPQALSQTAIYKGGFPELVTRHYKESELWYAAYLDTYLNKDVRALSQIGNRRDFRRCIQLLAAQVTQVLDLSHYAKDIGVSVPTIKRWLSILEASYVIFLLPTYYNNLGKRIIKSPKMYFYDTGLVSYLTGIKTYELYDKGPLAGHLFENYIVADILKKHQHTASDTNLYYYRTQDKKEIDLILDYKTHQDYIEIKRSSTFSNKFISTLKQYNHHYQQAYLLYNGKAFPHHGNISIINYADYL